MGVVYICHQDDTGDWAIKTPIFDDSPQGAERRERFTEEVKNWIRVSRRTQCPKIVRANSFMAEECLLVLEFVDGLSISQVARKDKPVRPVHPRHFLKWARDIAEALWELHEKFRMVHRDLKPQNVLIATEDLDAKVTDLGIAKAITDEQHTATIIGTLNYMAPEVFRGEVSFRSDIYSYGATLFWMLSCEHALALRGPLDRGWPPRIQQLVERCLQEDPASRPESFAHVLDLLDHAEKESEFRWNENEYVYCARHRFYSPVPPPGVKVDGDGEATLPVCLLCHHSHQRETHRTEVLERSRLAADGDYRTATAPLGPGGDGATRQTVRQPVPVDGGGADVLVAGLLRRRWFQVVLGCAAVLLVATVGMIIRNIVTNGEEPLPTENGAITTIGNEGSTANGSGVKRTEAKMCAMGASCGKTAVVPSEKYWAAVRKGGRESWTTTYCEEHSPLVCNVCQRRYALSEAQEGDKCKTCSGEVRGVPKRDGDSAGSDGG
jgi:hypothetical protein